MSTRLRNIQQKLLLENNMRNVTRAIQGAYKTSMRSVTDREQ